MKIQLYSCAVNIFLEKLCYLNVKTNERTRENKLHIPNM